VANESSYSRLEYINLKLIYWGFNEQVTVSQRIAALNKMQAAGLFPPQDAEIIYFYIKEKSYA